jgi:hypothetical protein
MLVHRGRDCSYLNGFNWRQSGCGPAYCGHALPDGEAVQSDKHHKIKRPTKNLSFR